eukprot:IDg20372t1
MTGRADGVSRSTVSISNSRYCAVIALRRNRRSNNGAVAKQLRELINFWRMICAAVFPFQGCLGWFRTMF